MTVKGRGLAAWLALAILYVALGALDLVDGLWLVAPFIASLAVARVVEARPGARRAIAVVTAVAAAGALVAGSALGAARGEWLWLDDADLATLAGVGAWGLTAAGVLLAALLLRPLRAALLRVLGLEPGSAVHVTVAGLYGLTLIVMAAAYVLLADVPGATVFLYLTDPLIALLSDVPLALAGVGWLLTRDLRSSLARLGFAPLRLVQAGWAAAAAAGFVVAVTGFDVLEAWLLPEVHAREGRFPLEFADVPPWMGALLVSLAAGVGEEAVFRGALQPRIGIVASSLLFAAVHIQYQVPGLILIFLVGAGLGVLRARTSTTFTALTHVLYDIGAFLIPEV